MLFRHQSVQDGGQRPGRDHARGAAGLRRDVGVRPVAAGIGFLIGRLFHTAGA